MALPRVDLSRKSHRFQEVTDDSDRFLAEPRSLFFVAVVGEKGSVGVWAVLVSGLESFREQSQRVANLCMVTDRALPRTAARVLRTLAEVQQAVDEVVRVLVLVAVLECQDLQHRV